MSRFITQSRYVAGRIRRVYGREAEVIPPPVDVQRFAAVTPRDGGYFLIVSRFEAYKRIDLAIQACRAVGVPLRIVGAGVDEARLRKVRRTTPRTCASLALSRTGTWWSLMAGCRAFLYPGEEDFGLTAVEAQAAGRPVIAFAQGGALETVIPGLTGAFFDEPSVEALAESYRRLPPGAVRSPGGATQRRPLRP